MFSSIKLFKIIRTRGKHRSFFNGEQVETLLKVDENLIHNL